MKLGKILEGRTNPALNVKKGVVQELRDFVDGDGAENKGHGVDGFFVHFSNISKIGINPQPAYDGTPIGVYAYPLKYVYEKVVEGESTLPKYVLPYAGDYQYAFIFKTDGLVVSLQDEKACRSAIKHIEDFVGEDYIDDLYEIIKQGSPSNINVSNMCKRNSEGKYTNLGGAVYGLPYLIFADLDHYPTKQMLVRWNKLYSMIGIAGLVDWSKEAEDAIIHLNEPTQAVFFDSTKLRVMKVLENNVKPTGEENNRDKTDFGQEVAARARTAAARKMFSRDDCREFVEAYMQNLLDGMGSTYTSFMITDDVKYEGKIKRELVKGFLRSSFRTDFFTKVFDQVKNHFDFMGRMNEHALAALRFDLTSEYKDFRLNLFEQIANFAVKGNTQLSKSIKKLISDALQKKLTNKVFAVMKDSIQGNLIFSKSELAKIKTVTELNSFLDNTEINSENVDGFIKAFGKMRLVDFISDMSEHEHEDPIIKMITHKILGVDQ